MRLMINPLNFFADLKTIVQIQVGDVNDNAPVFNQSAYKASIRENSPFHTYVIRIHATDPDRGTNGEVWYQIASGDTNNMFEIDNKTGVVYTVLPIDREQYERFTLTIKAEDKGKPKSRKVESKFSIIHSLFLLPRLSFAIEDAKLNFVLS